MKLYPKLTDDEPDVVVIARRKKRKGGKRRHDQWIEFTRPRAGTPVSDYLATMPEEAAKNHVQ